MTKIYEALQHAARQKIKNHRSAVIQFPKESDFARHIDYDMESSFTTLYQKILIMLPDLKCRIIQFVETTKDEGASVLIREFARVVAHRRRQKVLLLDASLKTKSDADLLNVTPQITWDVVSNKHLAICDAIYQIDDSFLSVSRFAAAGDPISVSCNMENIDRFFNELKNIFHLILINAPTVTDCRDAILIYKNLDGVILVVEAEKTRWQVVENAKERIMQQGGNILGVILNKRRYPIPNFIYKRI